MACKVHIILGGDRGRFPFSNCFLAEEDGHSILIDSGCGLDKLVAVRERVEAVVYTHVHPDHVWGWRVLEGKRSVVPEYDSAFISSLRDLARRYAPGAEEAWLQYVKKVFDLEAPPPVSEVYGSFETVRINGVELEFIPAPGHTLGHHYVRVCDTVILSDVDLTGFGPWYGHPESSIEAFLADMSAALELDARTYYTSHRERGFSRDELPGELGRYAAALRRHFESVLAALERLGCTTPRALAGRGLIYRRYLPGMEEIMRYFETIMIWKILEYATARGTVRRRSRGYCPATL